MLQLAEDLEKCRAELLLRFALYEEARQHIDPEELRKTDFRLIAQELTGSDSFTALAEYFKGENRFCIEIE